MSMKETIRHINRWDYRGFGWIEVFMFGAIFFLSGIGFGAVAAIAFLTDK